MRSLQLMQLLVLMLLVASLLIVGFQLLRRRVALKAELSKTMYARLFASATVLMVLTSLLNWATRPYFQREALRQSFSTAQKLYKSGQYAEAIPLYKTTLDLS